MAAPSNAAARSTLVPHGAGSLLLCDYGGLSAGRNSGRLTASAGVVGASSIAALTSALDALKASHGVFHCPMDDGSAITATFGYRDAAQDVVRLGLTGCQTVTNGKVERSAATARGEELIGRLRRILEPAVHAEPCSTAEFSASAQTQGENTTSWIGVTIQNLGRACMLHPAADRVAIEIEQASHPAQVHGNPLTLHPTGRLYHGGTDLLVADWSNWCGSRHSISLVVHIGSQTVRRRVVPLPVCLSKHGSKLLASPP